MHFIVVHNYTHKLGVDYIIVFAGSKKKNITTLINLIIMFVIMVTNDG